MRTQVSAEKVRGWDNCVQLKEQNPVCSIHDQGPDGNVSGTVLCRENRVVRN